MNRKIYWIVFWGLFIFATTCLVLFLRRPSVSPVATSPEAGHSFDQKFLELKTALRQGTPREIRITETELNSKILETIERRSATPSGSVTVEAAAVHLEADRFMGMFTLNMHGKSVFVTLGGTLGVQNHELQFTPTAVRMGSLPLPLFAVESVVRKKLISPELRERMKLPEAVKDVRIENRELVVDVG